ncbi:carbon storage regulator [candidate division KSB1 bacterium]|nr:carbon storage regulator [candidate division KSB1 bacterium]
MMNKTDVSEKYLATLHGQLARDQESIQLNAKIGTFLVNEGRVAEAMPYFMKIIEQGVRDKETREKLMAYLSTIKESEQDQPINGKYAAVSQSTMMGEIAQQDVADLLASQNNNQSQFDRYADAHYQPRRIKALAGRTVSPPVPNRMESKSRTVLITRRIGEVVAIDDEINISILDVNNQAVRLQLITPVDSNIKQDQSYLECSDINRRATHSDIGLMKVLANRIKRIN